MKHLRHWVPGLGAIALVALFFKLPATAGIFGSLGCATCSSGDPYLPLIAAGYFSALVAIALLFPAFPSPQVARGGLTWAVLLALALIYVQLPGWCVNCLIAHACHIAMWTIWVMIPPPAAEPPASTLRERMCLALFGPISVVALFACLNLTFMAYGFRMNKDFSATALKPGDKVPDFSVQTATGRAIANTDASQDSTVVLNFVSPDCPYCKEQLPVLNEVAAQSPKGTHRFVNISPDLTPELMQLAPSTEWVQDTGGNLRGLFDVSGYPTMLIVGNDGKVRHVISGVPEKLKSQLQASIHPPSKAEDGNGK